MKDEIVAAAVALALCAAPASAEFPYPPNPRPCLEPGVPVDCVGSAEYHRYLFLPETQPLTLPDDFRDNWKLSSTSTGDATIDDNPQELYGVKGSSVDLAWQVTTGRPDVVMAVLDSGIRWAEPLADLANKFFLNRGELPPPHGSRHDADPHDRNRDGVFNLRDYLPDPGYPGDPRVEDANANGVIDPEDLIFIFSDGIDDDGNGYTDDISGWDFFEDDNDALDEVRYGHGTGESHDSGAEANNGTGGVGTCPNCMLLEVRVGDSFVADANDFAQGVLFAVDSGARVIQEALGTLNQSSFGQAAVDYAYRNGVVIIASAADEESNHNNFPATYAHTVEVNSVTRFAEVGGVTQAPRSYLYLNGCTNFGGHIAFSVPSTSCSSEATGLAAGMAGLLVSAALDGIARGDLTPYPLDSGTAAPFPLSAEEIKQLLTETADDVNFDARSDVTPPLPQRYETSLPAPGVMSNSRYPSIAGWDQYFGYGRVNANAAVRRVRENRIPPEAALETPPWFALLRTAQQAVSITGRAAANRAASFRYVVEVAPGVQPGEEEFVPIEESAERRFAHNGSLATIDLTSLAALLPHGTEGPPVLQDGSGRGDPERFAFTVRLRVTDDRGNRAEDRRTLFLHDDEDLVPGYPRRLGGDGVSPPVTADLDADGREELIFGTSDGLVHALRLDGTELPGWPVATDPIEVHSDARAFSTGSVAIPRGAILGSVAVGDLDRDGRLRVVAADMEGKVYAWNAHGSLRAGFPVSTLPQYSTTRRSERDPDTPEGRVPDLVNRHDRDNRLARGIIGGVSLGNLDGSADGSLEILAGATDRHVYAWTNRGEPVPGWPVMLRDPEKVDHVDPESNEVRLVAGSGAEIGTKIIAPPSLGDLDGDGRIEVLSTVNEEYREEPNAVFGNLFVNLYLAAGVLTPGNTRVYAIHPDGVRHGGSPLDRGWNPDAFVDGWPVRTALMSLEILPVVGTGSGGPPALADVDGDGVPEIATMSVFGPVYIFDAAGRPFLGSFDTGEAMTLETDVLGPGSNSSDSPSFGAFGSPVFAQLEEPNGGFNVLAPAAGLGRLLDSNLPAQQKPADNHLAGWSVSGAMLAGFPRQVNDLQFLSAPAVADIDGDGLPEALQGSGVWELHAVNAAGIEAQGWPKFTGGWMVASPAVGDLDGDGTLEVAAVTREGNLFVWRAEGDACGVVPWRRYHHDEWGTGNHAADTRPPAASSGTSLVQVGTDFFSWSTRLPGDDLFCGIATNYDLRFSPAPIPDEDAFARATPVESVVPTAHANRVSALDVTDRRFPGRTLYFAMVAWDDADNRSPLMHLGPIAFGAFPTATPTRTATPHVDPSATPSPTVEPTSAPPPGTDSDGCQVRAPGNDAGLVLWALLPFLMRRKRSRR